MYLFRNNAPTVPKASVIKESPLRRRVLHSGIEFSRGMERVKTPSVVPGSFWFIARLVYENKFVFRIRVFYTSIEPGCVPEAHISGSELHLLGPLN